MRVHAYFSTLLKTRHSIACIVNIHTNANTYIIYIYIYSYELNVYALLNMKIKALNWGHISILSWNITQFRWGHEGEVTMAEFVSLWWAKERPGPFFLLLHEGTAVCGSSSGRHTETSAVDVTNVYHSVTTAWAEYNPMPVCFWQFTELRWKAMWENRAAGCVS